MNACSHLTGLREPRAANEGYRHTNCLKAEIVIILNAELESYAHTD